VYRTHGLNPPLHGRSGGLSGFRQLFFRKRAQKLTKWLGRGGYFPVSVLVLPGLALGNGAKRAFSRCHVEPNPDSAIYICDPSWFISGGAQGWLDG